jgi:hypothetical protein
LSGAYIVITVLQALAGGGLGIFQIVFIVISGAIIYFFYTDEGTKRTLGVP